MSSPRKPHIGNAGSSVLIVTGEASGDVHAAGLLAELKRIHPQHRLESFGSGGAGLRSLGVRILVDISQLAAIGPLAALRNLSHYRRLYREVLDEVAKKPPDLAILVDFPDFNLRLARRLKSVGVPVCYFISPQLWAWRSSRVKIVRRYVDLMLVILPFEEEFYRLRGVKSHYVGNPTAVLASKRPDSQQHPQLKTGRTVALMPGSRTKEVEQMLPIFLDAAAYIAKRRPTRFRIVAARSLGATSLEAIYKRWLEVGNGELDLEFVGEPTTEALSGVDCAIVKSGTSTLEAMVLEIPFAMAYRMSTLSYLFARLMVNVEQYCLANIVAGEKVVEEFIQNDARGDKIGAHILHLLQDGAARESLRDQLRAAAARLGRNDAYSEAAKKVATLLFPKEQAA